MSNDIIPVVMAFDDHYASYGLTVLQSILNRSDRSFSFFILYEKIDEKWISISHKLFDTSRSSIKFINVTSYFKHYTLPLTRYFTRTIYYRLAIPKIFKDYNKVIYLDADVIVKKDLGILLDKMNNHKAIGATRDILQKVARSTQNKVSSELGYLLQSEYEQKILGMNDPDSYFQSGVLIFNIPCISDKKITQCFQKLNQSFNLPDQDILNSVFKKDVHFFNAHWNMVSIPPEWGPNLAQSPYLPPQWRSEYSKAFKNPAIIHFPGSPKPWDNGSSRPYMEHFNATATYIENAITLNSVSLPEKILQQDSNSPIAVVIAFDANYARYGFTVLQSILNTAPSHKKFAFFVLHENLNESAISIGEKLFTKHQSTISFLDLSQEFLDIELPTRWHFARQTYYRLCIPYLFKNYNYVIYLDSDVIVRKDLSLILDEMDSNKAIGAARDIGYIAVRRMNHHSPDGCKGPHGENFGNMEVLDYLKQALKLEHPENYFQAGVLIFNIPRIEEKHIQQCLAMIPQNLWMQDQDILNSVFKDSLCLLNEKWNVLCSDESLNMSHDLPDQWKKYYHECREDPYIIHYAGSTKPWHAPNSDYASKFTQLLKKVNTSIHKITRF